MRLHAPAGDLQDCTACEQENTLCQPKGLAGGFCAQSNSANFIVIGNHSSRFVQLKVFCIIALDLPFGDPGGFEDR